MAWSQKDIDALKSLQAAGVNKDNSAEFKAAVRKKQNAETTTTGHSGVKITAPVAQRPDFNPVTGRENTIADPTGLNYYEDPRNPSAGQTGFYYDKQGNLTSGPLPAEYYYNDTLGMMVEGTSGYASDPGSALRPGATPGRAGGDVFSNPFSDGGTQYDAQGNKVSTNWQGPSALGDPLYIENNPGMLTNSAPEAATVPGKPPTQGMMALQSLSPSDQQALADLKEMGLDATGVTRLQRSVERTAALAPGVSTEADITKWWSDQNALRVNDPAAFKAWEESNPEMAIRWNAWAGNEGQEYKEGDTFSRKAAQDRAAELAYGVSQDLGYGEDGKMDGRSVAYNFSQFEDVQRNWGKGDFWKLGTPQTASNNGLFSTIINNPIADIAAVAFAPVTAGWSVAALEAVRVASGNKDFSVGDAALALIPAGMSQLQAMNAATSIATEVPKGAISMSQATQFGFDSIEAAENARKVALAAESTTELKDIFEQVGRGVIQNTDVFSGGGDDNLYGQPAWQDSDVSDVLGDVQVQVPDYSTPQQDGGGGGAPAASGGAPESKWEPEWTPEWEPGGGSSVVDDTPEVGGEDRVVNHEKNVNSIPTWTHQNSDGTWVAGNDYDEVWEIDPPSEVEDVNDWTSGLVLGAGEGDSTSSYQPGGSTGGTGTTGTNTGTGATPNGSTDTGTGTTGTGTTGTGSGDGGGEGDGEGDGQGDGPNLGSIATGLLGGAGGSNPYKQFMARLSVDFPLLDKLDLSPTDLIKLITAGTK
jgi:hypothetical protein